MLMMSKTTQFLPWVMGHIMIVNLLFSAVQECSGSRELCLWRSAEGATYDLNTFNTRKFEISLPNPRGSTLKFQLCSHPSLNPLMNCNNGKSSPTCLAVPGVTPTSTGRLPRVEQLEPNVPGSGFKLIYEDGEICEVTHRPRKTTIALPCSPFTIYKAQHFNPRKAWEGQKSDVCSYFVEFPPSSFGCPVLSRKTGGEREEGQHGGIMKGQNTEPRPEIRAVSGCDDSNPKRTTEDCHFAGNIKLVLHGLNFDYFCRDDSMPPQSESANGLSPQFTFNTAQCTNNFNKYYGVYIGDVRCQKVSVLSPFQINCTVEGAKGVNVDISVKRLLENGASDRQQSESESNVDIITTLSHAISFKEAINFRDKFAKFVELGVGGLKKEIDELYRRAFASRGKSWSS